MDDLDAVFESVAQYFSILAEPTRLRIMHVVCDGEKSVNEVVEAVGLAQSNVSRQLTAMHRAGALSRRRDGAQVYYAVADEELVLMCRAVCTRIAAQIDERRPQKAKLLRLMPLNARTSGATLKKAA